MSVLDSGSWWVDLAERVGRQLAQVALPIVAVVGASGGFDLRSTIVALLGAVLVTALKALAGVAVQPGEPLIWQLVDRAVPAAAGVLLGLVPVDLANLDTVDWSAAAYAAAAAAVTAVVAYWMTPPSTVVAARVVPEDSPVSESDELL